jgi:hypothetical protein
MSGALDGVAVAETRPATRPATQAAAVETSYQRDGIELRLINRAPDLPVATTRALVETFFEVYPTLRRTFNPAATARVTLLIDPDYAGVAEAGGSRIRVSARWFRQRPGDVDVITHEAMHLVQAYPGGAGPGWVTEGIADYVRHAYGVDNAGGGWSLPALRPEHRVSDSYRVTARFLAWLEAHVKPGIVRTLDLAMREKRYADTIWQQETGQSLDELWQRYAADPRL